MGDTLHRDGQMHLGRSFHALVNTRTLLAILGRVCGGADDISLTAAVWPPTSHAGRPASGTGNAHGSSGCGLPRQRGVAGGPRHLGVHVSAPATLPASCASAPRTATSRPRTTPVRRLRHPLQRRPPSIVAGRPGPALRGAARLLSRRSGVQARTRHTRPDQPRLAGPKSPRRGPPTATDRYVTSEAVVSGYEH